LAAIETTMGTAPSAVRTLGLSWPLLVAVFALIGVLGFIRPDALLSDADTYWHLAAGRWMLEHGAIPKGDPFSHSMPGAPWTTQSWLTELALAATYAAGGWSALVVLATTCFAITLAGLTRFLLARMEPVHALLFVGMAAAMMLSHLLVRPHVLVWPLFALWVGVQVNASESHRSPPWWLLVVMALWANLHGSFTLGLVLSCGIALDAIVAQPAASRRHAAQRWIAFVGLAVLISICTPNGLQGLLYTAQVMRQAYAQSMISEWQSLDFHHVQGLEIWLMLMLAMAWSGRVHLPAVRIVVLLGLVHLALVSGRSVATLGLVSPFILASPLARQWYSRGPLGGSGDAVKLDRWFRALAAPARPVSVLVAAVAVAALLCMIVPTRASSPAPAVSPEGALRAARAAGVSGEVLNDYGFGGFLIYQGIKVFIDGRSDLYGDAFLKRYVEAITLKEAKLLPALLDEHQIGWTLLAPGTPAIAMLDHLPGWRRVYADDAAVVHMRVAAAAVR
jgi:hypothetical protein